MKQDDIEIKRHVELVCDDAPKSKPEQLEVSPQKIAYRAQLGFPIVVFGMGALFSCACLYAMSLIIPKHLAGILDIGFGLFAVFLLLVSMLVLAVSAYSAVHCWHQEKKHEEILSSVEPFAAVPTLKLYGWTKFELECAAGEHPILIHGMRIANFFFAVLSFLLASSPPGNGRTVTLVFNRIPNNARVETPLELRIDMPMTVALNLKENPDKAILCVIHPETMQPYAVSIDETVFFALP